MKLGSIQLLRALAACMVVYWHCVIQMHFFAPGWRPSIRSGTNPGEYGVDLFFVISGFIIYHTAGGLGGRKQSLSYLWRRFRRINPVYYAATILTLIVWLPSYLSHRRAPVTGPDILTSLILLPFP